MSISEQSQTSSRFDFASAPLEGTVARIRRVTQAVTVIDITTASRTLSPWSPGAHITVGLPNGVERQYSLCGPHSTAPRKYTVAVKLDPESRGGSSFVHSALKRGDAVTISRPVNLFPFRPDGASLLLAAGIGVTAILPMAMHAARQRLPFTMIYLGKHIKEMPFVRSVRALRSRAHIIETQKDGRPHVTDIIERFDGEVFACGPREFLNAAVEGADELGRSIHVERFQPSVDPRSRPAAPFTVRCLRSGRTVEVAASESLADALKRNEISIRTSCRSGVCASCEVRAVSGHIDHRDSVLANPAQPIPDCPAPLMSCVSRGEGTLDLDI